MHLERCVLMQKGSAAATGIHESDVKLREKKRELAEFEKVQAAPSSILKH